MLDPFADTPAPPLTSRAADLANRARRMQVRPIEPPAATPPAEPLVVMPPPLGPTRRFGVEFTAAGVLFSQPVTIGRNVAVAGDFNGWKPERTPLLVNDQTGRLEATMTVPPGISQYRLVVDGAWIADPYNPAVAPNPLAEPTACWPSRTTAPRTASNSRRLFGFRRLLRLSLPTTPSRGARDEQWNQSRAGGTSAAGIFSHAANSHRPSRLWAAAGFGGVTEEFDALTDLFLGEVTGKTGVAAGAPSASRVEPSGPSAGEVPSTNQPYSPAERGRAFIECVVMGHLPVLASAWGSQYVREVAQAAGVPVAFVRVQSGFATVELVGENAPAPRGEDDDHCSLEEALREAAAVTDRWIVRADPGEEADIAARRGVRLVTLLTGPDEAARVSAYSLVKTLAKHLPPPAEADGPLVRLAMMSAPEQKADEAGKRLASVVREFLGRDVQHAICSSRIRATRPPATLFSGRTDPVGIGRARACRSRRGGRRRTSRTEPPVDPPRPAGCSEPPGAARARSSGSSNARPGSSNRRGAGSTGLVGAQSHFHARTDARD